jgi:hypothetical protein
MKKVILPSIFVASSLAIFALRGHFNSNNHYIKAPHNNGGAAAGKTGAPGEQNCTACHAGTAQNGANENILTVLNGSTPVTSYVPGQQYTVTLAMSSNPSKKGFQATALTSANSMAGTFLGQAGNTNINGTTKKYANHTSTSNTSATAPIWTWTWTAPNSGSGNVTFYVASNKANNNNNDNGDAIYLSQHILTEESSSSLQEQSFDNKLLASWDPSSFEIDLSFDLNKSSLIGINVVDSRGKSVFNKSAFKGSVGKNAIEIPSAGFSSGMYIVNLFIDNKPLSKKIIIP